MAIKKEITPAWLNFLGEIHGREISPKELIRFREEVAHDTNGIAPDTISLQFVRRLRFQENDPKEILKRERLLSYYEEYLA